MGYFCRSFFFQESLSILGALGIATIIAGILIIGFKKEQNSYKALMLPLLIGFFIGSYSSFDRLAIEYTSIYNLLFWKFTFAGIILMLTQIKQEELLMKIRKNIKMSTLAGLFILSAYFLVVMAMKYSNLGYVTVGRESGIAIACLFGYLFLKEKIDKFKLIGIIVLFSGVIILKFA